MKSINAEQYNLSNIAVKDINFKLMYKTYFFPLCRFAEKFVQHNAEDIVHDVFEIMWEKRDTIYIKEKLSSYLYRSVQNNCLKRLEHAKIVRNHSKHIRSMHKDGEPAHEENNPLFMLIFKDMEIHAEKIIKDLPKQRREILLLRVKEELSYQEIAKKLGIIEGTVKKQINRAMTKILGSLGLNKREK